MRVTSKGQVTIPRDLRELVGIELNSEVIFTVENGKLLVSPKDDPQRVEEQERLASFMRTLDRLTGTGDQSIDTDALMNMTRDR